MTQQIQYNELKTLQTRGPVDPGPDMPVEGTLLVAKNELFHFFDYSRAPEYGCDFVRIYQAFYNGERAFLAEYRWNANEGYSASGTHEEVVSLEDGLKLLLEHEFFAFPQPQPQPQPKDSNMKSFCINLRPGTTLVSEWIECMHSLTALDSAAQISFGSSGVVFTCASREETQKAMTPLFDVTVIG